MCNILSGSTPSLVSAFFQGITGLFLKYSAIYCSICYILYHTTKLNHGNWPFSCHVSLILLGLVVSILDSPFWYTIIKQMFYKEKHLTLSYISSNPYVVYQVIKRTTHKQPNWPMGTMCVSVCVPQGPICVCWVRGGQGFNKETGLVQGCQSACLGTCNVMESRWEPPDRTLCSGKQAVGARMTYRCHFPLRRLWV